MPYQLNEFEIDVDGGNEFALSIGKLILNFGAVELITYELIEILSKDIVLTKVAKKMMLGKRLDLLSMLVRERDLGEHIQENLYDSIKKVKKSCELRNVIAHNPFIYSINPDTNEQGAFSGIPNFKKSEKDKNIVLYSINEIREVVNEVKLQAEAMKEQLDNLKNVPNW